MSHKEVRKGTLSKAQERAVRLWDNEDTHQVVEGSRAEVPEHKKGASQVSNPAMGANVDDRRPVKYDTEELQKRNRI